MRKRTRKAPVTLAILALVAASGAPAHAVPVVAAGPGGELLPTGEEVFFRVATHGSRVFFTEGAFVRRTYLQYAIVLDATGDEVVLQAGNVTERTSRYGQQGHLLDDRVLTASFQRSVTAHVVENDPLPGIDRVRVFLERGRGKLTDTNRDPVSLMGPMLPDLMPPPRFSIFYDSETGEVVAMQLFGAVFEDPRYGSPDGRFGVTGIFIIPFLLDDLSSTVTGSLEFVP